MKTSYKGKTIFVPRHCLDEVEKLIAKRRRQHLIDGLSNLCRDGDKETRSMKAVIDATCEKEISVDDCAALIVRSRAVIPKLARKLDSGGIAFGRDYPAIYKWYVGGEITIESVPDSETKSLAKRGTNGAQNH